MYKRKIQEFSDGTEFLYKSFGSELISIGTLKIKQPDKKTKGLDENQYFIQHSGVEFEIEKFLTHYNIFAFLDKDDNNKNRVIYFQWEEKFDDLPKLTVKANDEIGSGYLYVTRYKSGKLSTSPYVLEFKRNTKRTTVFALPEKSAQELATFITKTL